MTRPDLSCALAWATRAVSLLLAAMVLPFGPVALGGSSPCVLEAPEAGNDRLSLQPDGSWLWQPQGGDVVRCDRDAHEPLDTLCPEEGCSTEERRLELLAGRRIEIFGPRPEGSIDLEWRRFGEPGEGSEPIARRRLTPPGASEPWILYSAAEEDRLLRVHRPGSAPETFFVPAHSPEIQETAADPWPITPRWPGSGGEVFGFVEASDDRPTLVRLEGEDWVRELLPDAWGRFVASGLRPGSVRLQAEFRGGWRSEGPPVLVRNGETTELLPWDLPRSGALELTLEPELCGAAERTSSLDFVLRKRGARRILGLEAGACSHRFEGLPPGEWTLTLGAPGVASRGAEPTSMRPAMPGGSPVSTTVSIEAGAVSTATLERPRIFIEGHVIAGGEGLPGFELRLTRGSRAPAESAPGEAVLVEGSAYTDGSGTYTLEAPALGSAVLQLYSEGGYPVIRRDVELTSGPNRQDFDLGAGRLRVLVTSADGAPEGPVTLEVWGAGVRRLVRTGTLDPDQEETMVYGLDFGRYELSAFSEDGLATFERPVVELGKLTPSEEVELVLEKQRVVATVLDPTGQPVPGLLVALDQRQLAETGERPGEYSLLGASAGSELRVVPPLGYLPVCRRLERIEPVEITLRPADSHALLIPPEGPLPPAGSFLGALENLPGSNCAMPVSLLWRPVEDATGRTLVRLDGLTRGTFLFRNAEGVVIVQLPGPPTPMPGVE